MAILTYFKKLIKSHITFFHSQVYVIGTPASSQNNAHFYFALLAIILTLMYGIFYLPFEKTGKLTFANLRNFFGQNLFLDVYIFTHQMTPPSVWKQYDVTNSITTVITIATYINFINLKPIDTQFSLQSQSNRISIGPKHLNVEQSRKIFQLFKFIKWAFYMIIWPFYALLLVFLYVNLYINNFYTVNAGSVLFWTLLMPLFSLYIFYAIFASSAITVVHSRIIQIRQISLLTKLKLSNLNTTKHSFRVRNYIAAFSHYLWLMQSLHDICRYTLAHSGKIQQFLSIILPYFVSVLCYVLYAAIFILLSDFDKLLYWNTVAVCNVYLFVIINQAAQIDRHAQAIEVECRRFSVKYMKFYSQAITTYAKVALTKNLFKAEAFAVPKRLENYVFCMWGNNRITTKTYDLVSNFKYDNFVQQTIFLFTRFWPMSAPVLSSSSNTTRTLTKKGQHFFSKSLKQPQIVYHKIQFETVPFPFWGTSCQGTQVKRQKRKRQFQWGKCTQKSSLSYLSTGFVSSDAQKNLYSVDQLQSDSDEMMPADCS